MAGVMASLILMPDLALWSHTQEGPDLLGELATIYQQDSKVRSLEYQRVLCHKRVSFIMIVTQS